MNQPSIPMLLEPEALPPLQEQKQVMVIDLSRESTHRELHIPGAIHLNYSGIVAMKQPVAGLLPDMEHLSSLFSAIGLTEETHVVAYDDEGGGKACRLIWTLECIGHKKYSLLNGGLHAWANEGFPLSKEETSPAPADYQATHSEQSQALIESAEILKMLDDESTALLDVRTPEEFRGIKKYATRGGHIPGAKNIDWTEFMDKGRNLRLKEEADIRQMLEAQGITPEQTVITYCQTHHRSAYSWFVLHHLGYQARGYHGSWSDWGNHPSLPVEV